MERIEDKQGENNSHNGEFNQHMRKKNEQQNHHYHVSLASKLKRDSNSTPAQRSIAQWKRKEKAICILSINFSLILLVLLSILSFGLAIAWRMLMLFYRPKITLTFFSPVFYSCAEKKLLEENFQIFFCMIKLSFNIQGWWWIRNNIYEISKKKLCNRIWRRIFVFFW